MSKVSVAYIEKGIEQGLEQGLQKWIIVTLRDMIKNLGIPIDQAIAAASIPENQRPKYKALLEEAMSE